MDDTLGVNTATVGERTSTNYNVVDGVFGYLGGAITAFTNWYFAEGTTAGTFKEWLLILNPNNSAVQVTPRFFYSSGSPETGAAFSVPAQSRYTLRVNDVQENKINLATHLTVSGSSSIYAERSMYWNVSGNENAGGNVTIGISEIDDATTWYFAEGKTTEGFTEYITLLNTSSSENANVTVTLTKTDGTTADVSKIIAPLSRATVNVNDTVIDPGIAAKVVSTNAVPIVAERVIYWNAGILDNAGSHCTLGAPAPAAVWYFAEGYTGPNFKEWLVLYNPDSSNDAEVTITFYQSDADPSTHELDIDPGRREVVYVNDIVPGVNVSAKVASTNGTGIVAERVMYWDSDLVPGAVGGLGILNWAGGSVTKGIAEE